MTGRRSPRIADVLGDNEVSVRRGPRGRGQLIMVMHPVSGEALRRALKRIAKLDFLCSRCLA